MDDDDMLTPREDISPQDATHENTFRLEKISCATETELSEGSQRILNHQSPWLFAFFRCKLSSHNIQEKYSEWEIFSEAYHRATESLRKERKIDNLYGWYKATGYNIIREYSRKERKQRELRNKLKVSFNQASAKAARIERHLNPDSEIVNIIQKTVKNQIDIKIILLRTLHDFSWMEVCEVLIRDGDLNCELSKQCIERVRQRYHRALKKIPRFREQE